MAKRVRLDSGGAYFEPQTSTPLFPSGCPVLDCALGGGRSDGGWPEGKMVNVVGDKSTGKTLLAIEAVTNFAHKHPDGELFYRETEAAFDDRYAKALGMPMDRLDMLRGLETVEDLHDDLQQVIKNVSGPAIYVVDCLDALSDRAEKKREIDEATFGGEKAKKLSQLFRRLIQPLDKAGVTFFIISQVRDNIGVMFGEKHTRAGGKALDFYASQIVWLAHKKQLHRTIRKVKRVTGVQIMAKVKKNKIGPPFREAEFPITFGYGIDDVAACCEWLESVNADMGKINEPNWKAYHKRVKEYDDEQFAKARRRLAKRVVREWVAIEENFAVDRRKY